ERYEQLRRAWKAFSQSAPAQQLSTQVSDAALKAGGTLREKAAAGVSKGTERIRPRSSNGQAIPGDVAP
ncbi:MAG: hypothetical protein ACRDZO_24710, partial [Egibacteraceae bacterium]